jgi:hypothetical protein
MKRTLQDYEAAMNPRPATAPPAPPAGNCGQPVRNSAAEAGPEVRGLVGMVGRALLFAGLLALSGGVLGAVVGAEGLPVIGGLFAPLRTAAAVLLCLAYGFRRVGRGA